MKRIIIQIYALNKSNWNIIYRLFEACNGRSVYTKELYNTLKQQAMIVVDDNPIIEDVYSTEGKRDLKYSEIANIGNCVFNIIYKKTDEREEFPELSHFFLLKKKYSERLTIGIDVSVFSNSSALNEYVFKCSIFLYFIKDKKPSMGDHSIYFINVTDSKTGEIKKTESLRYKNQIVPDYKNASPFILPLLPINKESFGFFDGVLPLKDPDVELYIENSIENIKKKLGRKRIDIAGCNTLFEKWILFSYCLSVKEGCNRINEIKSILIEYCHSIFELIQNVIFHSEDGRGLFYVVISKKGRIPITEQEKIPYFSNYDDSFRFIKFGIYDYGEKGILKTFCDANKNDVDVSFLKLDDFFSPEKKITGSLSKHLGIKTFVKSIIEHKGYFSVETNETVSGKRQIERSGDNTPISKAIDGNICGTLYDVIMPVSIPKSGSGFVYHKSVFDVLKGLLRKRSSIEEIRPDGIVRFADAVLLRKDEQENLVKKEAIDLLKTIKPYTEKRKNYIEYGIAINMDGIVLNPNMLYKLIDNLTVANEELKLFNSSMIRDFKLIFTNLTDGTIKQLCEIYKLEFTNANNKQSWLFPVVLIGKKWKIQILYGKTKKELFYANKIIHNSFLSPDLFYDEYKDTTFNIETDVKNCVERLNLPYDILIINNSDGNGLYTSFINQNLDTALNNAEEDLGCRLDISTKIGSKLYVEHYYEADFLFQNNYFTDRFAFFVAKEIIRKIDDNAYGFNRRIVLIGYNPYSGPLTERIRDYVNYVFPQKVTDIIIAKEKNNAKGLDFKMTDHQRSRFCEKSDDFGFITIVPIASTLSTNDKIVAQFKMKIKSEQDLLFVYNYVTVLVRDKVNTHCSRKELNRKWNKIDNQTIKTSYQKTIDNEGMHVDFLIQKEGKWHNLIDKDTFPVSWWEEKYINQTRNASLNTKDFLGLPSAAIPQRTKMIQELEACAEKFNLDAIEKEYYYLNIKRLNYIKRFVYYGHIVHDNSHHQYYFDIERLFDTFWKDTTVIEPQQPLLPTTTQLELSLNSIKTYHSNDCLKKWLSYLKGRINKEVLNIIITPDYDYESCYVNTINKEVFDNDAFVIYLNITNPKQNSKQKLLYLKNSFFSERTHVYFVDQAFLTGDSYLKSISHISSIFDKYDFKYDGIITMINRLSIDKYEEILHGLKSNEKEDPMFFSYLHFFILTNNEQERGCYLCRMRDFYKNLRNYSVIKDCRAEIERNKEKYDIQKYSHYLKDEDTLNSKFPDTIDSNRYGLWLMLWQHKLFYELTIAKSKSSINDEKYIFGFLDNLYEEGIGLNRFIGNKRVYSVESKMAFLRAISFPPLAQYVIIRKYSHKKQLEALHDCLDKENPCVTDFEMLKQLLENLSLLGSNALVRKDVIIRSWNLYNYVRHKCSENLKLKNDEFCSFFLSCIKAASYKDEAKSLWIGELIRTGEEMNSDSFESEKTMQVSKTILFNSLFSEFSGRSRIFRGKFLPQLFYDNTAITRKTLDNFELALKKDRKLNELFYEQERLRSFEHISNNIHKITGSLKEKIDLEYYYAWFRHFLNDKDRTADNILILDKFAYVLYARLLLNDLMDSDKKNNDSFDKNAEKLIAVAMAILNADAAYITVRSEEGDDVQLITLAKLGLEVDIKDYSNLYSSKLLCDSTSDKGSPFIIKNDISNEGDSKLGSYEKATYLLLNIPDSNNPAIEKPVSVVTFLYSNSGPMTISENTDVTISPKDYFMINAQESGRLLLLLKPEFDNYAKHISNEKQFVVWKEKQYSLDRFEKVYSNSNHVFNSVFDQMSEFENMKNDIKGLSPEMKESFENMIALSFGQTWYWLTNEMISYLYANIERHTENGRHYLSLDRNKNSIVDSSHTIHDVFSSFFLRMLKNLLMTRWTGQQIFINGVNISEKDAHLKIKTDEVKIHCNKYLIQTFIVQCLNNSLRSSNEDGGHRICDNKKVMIVTDKNSILIQDVVIEGGKPSNEEMKEFALKKEKIKQMNCRKYSCTTLTSLQGFVNYMNNQENNEAYHCEFGYNSNSDFEVRIIFES